MTTPQPLAKKLARALGLDTGLYLKREDLHPHGSHKGRSIPVMIEKYAKSGAMNFCISSSGNAAISAAMFVNEYNTKPSIVIPTVVEESLTPDERDPSALLGMTKKLTLKIFVGKNVNNEKLKIIKQLLNKTVLLQKVTNPKQTAFKMDKSGLVKNLRQSTDDIALRGYASLAKELARIKNLSAVFIPTSSGTTAQALHVEFKKLKLNPQIHIVQTPACHPMISSPAPTGHSIAGAIVDKVGFRKEAVQNAMRDSNGRGWIATDKDIVKIKRLVKKTAGFNVSPNSALSIVGLKLALQNNWRFAGPVVCLITGR